MSDEIDKVIARAIDQSDAHKRAKSLDAMCAALAGDCRAALEAAGYVVVPKGHEAACMKAAYEDAAKVAEQSRFTSDGDVETAVHNYACNEIAAAIRAKIGGQSE